MGGGAGLRLVSREGTKEGEHIEFESETSGISDAYAMS